LSVDQNLHSWTALAEHLKAGVLYAYFDKWSATGDKRNNNDRGKNSHR
jgi:hypothetical protein